MTATSHRFLEILHYVFLLIYYTILYAIHRWSRYCGALSVTLL